MKKQYFISLLLILFSVMGFSQTIQRIEAETFNTASGVRAEVNATLSDAKISKYIPQQLVIVNLSCNHTELI